MEDDWGLQAVVRGCCTSSSSTNTTTTTTPSPFLTATTTTTAASIDPFSFLSPLLLQEDDDDENQHLLSFPDLLATQTTIQELEQLCKPFFPQTQGALPLQHQHQHHPRPLLTSTQTTSQIPRSKRRKNQQKRVVRHVPAEGLSSDMWAWRKYGQKPIKGSPYPRGYYRCSSSKGCLARKQVERSRSDPSMFVITYTSEHNHPLPTHRNSLAGSTRHKSTSSSASCKPSGSPTTTLSPTSEHRQEEEDEEEEEEEEEEELLLPDIDMVRNPSSTEEMFLDLEELREPTTTSSPVIPFDDCFPLGPFPSPWFPNNAATAAGGS